MAQSRAAVVGSGAWLARRSVRPRSQLKASVARGWSFGSDGRWVSTEQAARTEAPPAVETAPTSPAGADALTRRAPSPVAHLSGGAPVSGQAAQQRASAVASAVAAWPARPPETELERPPGVLIDEGEIAVHEVDTVEEALRIVAILSEHDHLIHACDTEVADIDIKRSPLGQGRVICLSCYSGPDLDLGSGKGAALWVDTTAPGVLDAFKPWLQRETALKVWHNYGFDRHVLYNHGIDVRGFGGDTMHMARLWDASRKAGYSLAALTEELVGRAKVPMKTIFGEPKLRKDGSPGRTVELPPVLTLQTSPLTRPDWIQYSVFDAKGTWLLYRQLEARLVQLDWQQGQDLFTFYKGYWRPFGELLTEMERNGVMVDVETKLPAAQLRAQADRDEAEVIFRRWASKYCPAAWYMNVGSGSQVQALLFGGAVRKRSDEVLPLRRTFKLPRDEFDALHAARLGAIDEDQAAYGLQRSLTSQPPPPAAAAAAAAAVAAAAAPQIDLADATQMDCAAVPEIETAAAPEMEMTAAAQIDVAGLSVAELKAEMRSRGLRPLTGRKADLAMRLGEAMAEEARRQGGQSAEARGGMPGSAVGRDAAAAAGPGIAAPGIDTAEGGTTVAWAGQAAAAPVSAASVSATAWAAGAARIPPTALEAALPPATHPGVARAAGVSPAAPFGIPPLAAGAVGAPFTPAADLPVPGVHLNPGRRDVEIEISSLKLEHSAVTASGWPATDAASLRELAGAPTEHPPRYGSAYAAFGGGEVGREACVAIEALCRMGAIDTMLNNFILPLQDMADSSSRIHCSLNLNTETGRLSSRAPNLQNQPALEKDKYLIRDAFTAGEGQALVVADYGQLELRLLAHMTKCESMLDAFRKGGCFHSRTAMGMFDHVRRAVEQGDCLLEWDYRKGKPPAPLLKDVFGSERRRAKTLNFSIAYGKTAHGLSKDWGVSIDEANEMLRAWYADRPEVEAWQRETKASARRTGATRTLLGRYRKLPGIDGRNGAVRGHMERAAINTPIQGGAADIMTLAMIKLQRSEKLKEMGFRMLLQVHDEVMFEGPEHLAHQAMDEVVACMQRPFDAALPSLLVDLAVDANVAKTWYGAK